MAVPAVGIAATEIQLLIKTAFGYKGDAFCTSIAPSVDVNGVAELVINFRGTGALTLGAV